MTEKGGFDQLPPYNTGNQGFTNQYGADYGPGYPKGNAYPQSGGAYPPPGGPYPSAGGAYPAQPGVGQAYSSHSTTAVIVNQPGVAGTVIVQQRPRDFMRLSIFACLFCFWPTGLCAIYYAFQANKLAAEGDMVGATKMANNARNLMFTSIVIGVIWVTLVTVLPVVLYDYDYDGYNDY